MVPVDIDTNKIRFFTVSTEDLVISKLCAGRDKDFEDIESKEVTESLDWQLLDKLADDICFGMLNDYDVRIFKSRYQDYKERYK